MNTTTNKMVDSFGRERYFHGINVVVKGPPWIPNTQKFSSDWSFTDEDMKLLNELGVNVVRYECIYINIVMLLSNVFSVQ